MAQRKTKHWRAPTGHDPRWDRAYVGTLEPVERACSCGSRNLRRVLTPETFPVGTVLCIVCLKVEEAS